MKSIIFIICLIAMVGHLSAQPYQSHLTTGNKFYYKDTFFPNGNPIVSYYNLTVGADTIFANGLRYNLLGGAYYHFNTTTGVCYKYQNCAYSDTNDNVVYFDLSKSVGQTFTNCNATYTVSQSGFQNSILNSGLNLKYGVFNSQFPGWSFTASELFGNISIYYNAGIIQLQGALVNGSLYGDSVTTSLSSNNEVVPISFSLHQNFPNPFNPVTKIRFDVPLNEHVSLTVFNSLGQQVAVLINQSLKPGSYEYTFDASGVASGVYFYKLNSNTFSKVMKMILVK